MSTFIGQLIGFAVIVFVFVRYILPPLGKAMSNQQAVIGRQIEDSDHAKARLADAERKYADAIAEARVETAKIRDNARSDAARIGEEMREQAKSEVARIQQRGEEQLTLQRQQVVHELRAQLGGSTVGLAQQLVRQHVGNADARSATVDNFLGELEGMASSTTAQTQPVGKEA